MDQVESFEMLGLKVCKLIASHCCIHFELNIKIYIIISYIYIYIKI